MGEKFIPVLVDLTKYVFVRAFEHPERAFLLPTRKGCWGRAKGDGDGDGKRKAVAATQPPR